MDQKPPEAGSSFRPAFLLLDKSRREALSAYYAFARTADDIADDPAVPVEEKSARLEAWRCGVEGLFCGDVPDTPMARNLAAAIAAFPLKKEHFLLVLDGVTMDLSKTEYATRAELEYYMYRVAGAVGMACLAISGYTAPKADQLAEKMGYAVQLTNIIRDAAEDYAAGRVYIPAEDLKRFNCRPADLGGSNYNPDFIELMRFEAAKAENYYAEAAALADPAMKRRLAPALLMGGLYRELLARIARGGFRIKEGRVRLNRAQKAAAVIKTLAAYIRI